MKHQLIKIMRSKSFLIGVLDGVDGEIGFSAALECLLKRMSEPQSCCCYSLQLDWFMKLWEERR
jgi:hypothetical protein